MSIQLKEENGTLNGQQGETFRGNSRGYWSRIQLEIKRFIGIMNAELFFIIHNFIP